MQSNRQSSHVFSQVPKAEIPRSSFDRSHGHKTAFDAGYLIPVLVDEALPGDTFNCRLTGFARMATPIFPVMDNLFMDTHFFAVPLRLLWTNWQKFCGEQTNPGDSTSFVLPIMTAHIPAVSSLSDYMGLPTAGQATNAYEHVSLFHRAYNLIYNQWFRDENMQNSVVVDVDNGPDAIADYVLLQRGKRHDYFTSALPWPQKGTAVSMPLGTTAPVTSYGSNIVLTSPTDSNKTMTVGAGGTPLYLFGAGGVGGAITFGPPGTTTTGLQADLTNATAATINQLRQSFQVQRLLERDARGGTRYTEILKAHFGVTSPDARLQRPEYLGGGSTQINVSQVPQTSSTDATTPQGNLSAFATATLHNNGFTKSFTEHCIIIGLVSVRADLNYQQGLQRMFKRSTRYDFFWPALAHIGEQTILQGEIYKLGTAADDTVFGYQERYAEYRYKPSMTTGLLRSTAAATLDAWHVAQKFTAAPTLNGTFIVENPAVDRVVAVPTQPHFIFDSYISMKCARPMSVYGVPGFIDHF
nr:MAG TPA: Capsid protein [Microviridae sp.]